MFDIVKSKSLWIFILIFLMLFETLTEVNAKNNKKLWNEGKLIWSDFQDSITNIGTSEIKYFIGYESVEKKINDTTFERFETICYFDRNLSWSHPDYKNETYLRFNQIIFDIAELNRRILQRKLDRLDNKFQAENEYNNISYICSGLIEKFIEESNHGRELNAIKSWELKIKEDLKQFENDNMPKFNKGNFGYGGYVGLGTGILTGSIYEHFSQIYGIIFGFDLSYNNSILFLYGTLGGDKVKKDYFSEKQWNTGQTAFVAIIDMSYGYTVFEDYKIKLSPFIGLGITEFTGPNRKDKENNPYLVNANLIFGINTDYKLCKTVNYIPDSFLGFREYNEVSVRTRLYITRANYSNDLNGYSINLSIGISVLANLIDIVN